MEIKWKNLNKISSILLEFVFGGLWTGVPEGTGRHTESRNRNRQGDRAKSVWDVNICLILKHTGAFWWLLHMVPWQSGSLFTLSLHAPGKGAVAAGTGGLTRFIHSSVSVFPAPFYDTLRKHWGSRGTGSKQLGPDSIFYWNAHIVCAKKPWFPNSLCRSQRPLSQVPATDGRKGYLPFEGVVLGFLASIIYNVISWRFIVMNLEKNRRCKALHISLDISRNSKVCRFKSFKTFRTIDMQYRETSSLCINK